MVYHLAGLRAATAMGAHVSTKRGSWAVPVFSLRQTLNVLIKHSPQPPQLFPMKVDSLTRRVDTAGLAVPDSARRAFQLFAEDVAAAAPTLSLWTRWLTYYCLGLHVQSHCMMHDDLAKHPCISETPLRPPVFIMGLPRTGTTLLHHLMALDPDSQCLRAYELMRPVRTLQGFLPAWVTDCMDWAKLTVLCHVASAVAPQWRHHHDIDAGSPEECLFALQRSLPLDTHYRARSQLLSHYSADPAIPEEAYGSYRQFLQQVQVRRDSSEKRYVLKGQLLHLQYLEALCSVFPDAKLVWTHRPPSEVVGSLCSLRRSQHEVLTAHPVDPNDVGRGTLEYLSGALVEASRALEHPCLQAGPASADKLLHVQYQTLVADPIRIVEAVYESWGWQVSPAHRDAMERYLDKSYQMRSRRGKDRSLFHDASLERYGLTAEEVDQHFVARGVASIASMGSVFNGSAGVVRHSEAIQFCSSGSRADAPGATVVQRRGAI